MQPEYVKFARLALLLIAAILSTSCLILTEQQLIDPHNTRTDRRLKGRWVGTDKLDDVYALFDGGSSLKSNIMGKGETAKSDVTFDVANGRIGKYWYLSLKPRDDSADKGYLLVRYSIERNQLKVWLLDSPLIDTAIADGKLKGDKSSSSNTMLTDNPEKLRAFIIQHENDGNLFEYLGTFKKVSR
jgi:hypothetical protein